MKKFNFTYHFKGRAKTELIVALSKVLAVKLFFATTPNISLIKNLEIHKL